MHIAHAPRRTLTGVFLVFGPGIVWAAAAIGSGELIVAAKVGSEYGMQFAWALVLGVVLKFFIHLAILDVSIAAGRPIVDVWHEGRAGRLSSLYWFVFFAATATGVAGLVGLSASAAAAILPVMSVKVWATVLTVGIIGIALFRYERYEKFMLMCSLVLVVGMCVTVWYSVPDMRPLEPWSMPKDAAAWLVFLALLGWGAGSGPDLMLPYSWWVAEKRAVTQGWVANARLDLGIGYVMTALVAGVFMLAGALVLSPLGVKVDGINVLTRMSAVFTGRFGDGAFLLFMIPAFVALYSTALGVFDGGRLALAHLALRLAGREPPPIGEVRRHPWYRATLIGFALVPLAIFLGVQQPVTLVLIAGAISAISMPLLALQTLLSLLEYGRPGALYFAALLVAFGVYGAFALQALLKLL